MPWATIISVEADRKSGHSGLDVIGSMWTLSETKVSGRDTVLRHWADTRERGACVGVISVKAEMFYT